jgi:hypothetical protein
MAAAQAAPWIFTRKSLLTHPLSEKQEGMMRIRKAWAVLLGIYVISFIAGIFPYLRIFDSVHLFQILQIALDLVILYGLWGYVTYRPIKFFALRLLYLALVLIIGLRVMVVGYLFLPDLWPWGGDREQYISALLVLSLPLALLAAYALWSYAVKAQSDPTPRA